MKQERLPYFLQSDFYLEYRLAKLLSQVRVNTQRGLSIKFDYTKPVPPKEPKAEVDEEYDPAQVKRVIIILRKFSHDCYEKNSVC